ncbi:SMI1/KNR4 family protein [Streptomyces muensis]|uniref:SMI1/KNR4 family protein n=1 Tax=Streptomyces muensis TaxID=1077944 RepID=A0A9X1PZR3_STRM4|nr:SMI1/KNR4 family protein [Streptomyces muensis]MCF1595489.1 SMI1/KNR4 family protein [Streptomyces muensis]
MVLRPILKEQRAVNVEIPPFLHETALGLGAGVPYALKVLAGRLAEDPDMGRPSQLPGILTVVVDGEPFDDCPDLAVGYIREPDWIQIRYVSRAAVPERDSDEGDGEEDEQGQEQVRATDPAAGAVAVRQVADAWQRIAGWLRDNAPESSAALRAGAGPAAIAAVEQELGVRIPVELCVLWLLTAGDDGVRDAGCLPGNRALMPLDAVVAEHRWRSEAQAREDTLDADRPDDERTPFWRPTWIPVVSRGVNDSTSGLYLDTETGFLGRWSLYNDDSDDELDTLVTYLEEAADMLDAPTLATRDKPGLVGGALVWRGGLDAARLDRWRPLTDTP